MEAQEDVLKKFIGLGLSESKAKETIKNSNVTNNLLTIIKLVNSDAIPQPNGILLYHLATKMKPQMARHLPILVEYIMQNNLDSTLRVDKAIEYAIGHIDNFSKEDFKNYCGIGVVVTPEQIENAVETLINENKEEIISKRYRFNSGLLMQKVRNSLPWADGKAVKNEIDLQFVTLLGPKTEADLAPPPKQEKKVKVNINIISIIYDFL